MPRFVLVAFVVLFAAAHTEAGSWVRFRGPAGAGVADGQNLPVKFTDKSVAWKVPLPGPSNGCPVVWENYVFMHTTSPKGDQRILLCLDAATGKERWQRTLAAAPAHIHQRNSLASSTPTTDGKAVFVYVWDGKGTAMVAFDFEGKLLWNRHLGSWTSQHGPGTSPIVYKDTVFITNDMDFADSKNKPVEKPSTLYALDKRTGNVLWQAPREAYRACYSAPMILEKPGKAPELIVTSSTSIRSYNPDTGEVNWNWTFDWSARKMPLRTVGSTLHHDGMLFPCSGDGGGDRYMCALDITGADKSTTPKKLFENKKDFPYVPCVLAKGDHLFFVNDKGFAGCVEARTGKKVWFERLPEANFTSSPVLVDGKIYAFSEEGDVFVIAADPNAFQLLARNTLGERFRSSPAVADGRLFIRGQTHLFCITQK